MNIPARMLPMTLRKTNAPNRFPDRPLQKGAAADDQQPEDDDPDEHQSFAFHRAFERAAVIAGNWHIHVFFIIRILAIQHSAA